MAALTSHILYLKSIRMLITIGFWCSSTVMAACLGDTSASQVHSFEVVPQFTAAKLHSHWSPLLQRVGQDTGLCFELRISPSIPAFEQHLLRGTPDFAYVNPYHAVLGHQRHRYQAVLADGKNMLTGILVVRQDSPIRSVEDLHGKNVSFPAPNSFAATLLIRSELAKKQIHLHPVFVNTHSNVYRSVLAKDVAAGGGVQSTLTSEPGEMQAQLRVLYKTEAYSPHPVVAHPRVPEAVRIRLLKGIQRLAQDDSGRAMLENIHLPQPQAVTYERHYKTLESLKLEKFLALTTP